ncbi:MAG: Lrp/AsnC ligand binding domain-containing protein [Candidatus Aenigmatarchaeota archaeon]
MKAYVQIAVETGRDSSVHAALKQIPQCKEAHVVFGDWDIISLFEIANPEELGQLVVSKIRTIAGVKLTKTLIVAN